MLAACCVTTCTCSMYRRYVLTVSLKIHQVYTSEAWELVATSPVKPKVWGVPRLSPDDGIMIKSNRFHRKATWPTKRMLYMVLTHFLWHDWDDVWTLGCKIYHVFLGPFNQWYSEEPRDLLFFLPRLEWQVTPSAWQQNIPVWLCTKNIPIRSAWHFVSPNMIKACRIISSRGYAPAVRAGTPMCQTCQQKNPSNAAFSWHPTAELVDA